MHKKILITGAGGFIGKHLTHYLNQYAYQIITCGRNISATCSVSYTIDLNTLEIYDIIKKEQPDYIVHCAGGASVAESFSNPKKDFIKNVSATENLLNAVAQESPDSNVIMLSSAAVYGAPEEFPIKENTPTKPISPYGYHKLASELIGEKYHKLHNIPLLILRIFSVYGPGLKKQLLWDIYQKSKNNEAICLFGTGDETRDFIFIHDLVEIIHQMLLNAPFKGETINVASGQSTTVRKIASLTLSALKNNKPLLFDGNHKPGDPTKWVVDIANLRKFLKRPFTPLSDGIQMYTDWLARNEVVA